MTRPVQLVLVIHNHQPVGNFDHVFEDACERAYLPFLRLLRDYPAVRIGLHTSGCLWEWVEQHKPEYGQLVEELLAAGQLELLGGGMYEPILPVLPTRDALWQLERLSGFIEQRFGARPTGAWIPERVWEPQLPEVLAAAGISYCLLDDYHFEGNAPTAQIATEYFMTQHASSRVAILPISKELRYSIPFKPAQDTINYLRRLGEESDSIPLSVFGDDGEKFGIWPDTYDWVYTQGWLRSFFEALSDNQEWLQIKLPTEVLAERAPAETVYIPSRSYSEMGEWTRVDGDGQPGHWRNFLSKYPESRQMYDRVVEVSDALHTAEDAVSVEARDDLGRAQCNCSYWHGVFGGLYLNYLRAAVTKHLLKAERSIDPVAAMSRRAKDGGTDAAATRQTIRLQNNDLSLTLNPSHGLSVSRIDYYATLFNWADVLARRSEIYHGKLLDMEHAAAESAEGQASIHEIVRVKEPGLKRRLVVDPHPRHSFVTCFSHANSPEQFMFVGNEEQTATSYVDWNLPAQIYSADATGIGASIEHGDFRLNKRLSIAGATTTCELQMDDSPRDVGDFFVELNLTVLTDQADDRYMLVDGERRKLNEGTTGSSANQVALVDEWQQRRAVLTTSIPAKLISYPVYTVSSSEGGFERTYQGTCIMLGFDPSVLREGLTITLRIEEL